MIRAHFIRFVVGTIAFFPQLSFGAHPLITEDTGTQGARNGQIEITGEWADDYEDGETVQPNMVLSYGLTDNLDLVVGVPHSRIVSDTEEGTITEEGLNDVGLDFKWRFYEEGVISFAIKTGVTFPTGDETRGLGTGETTYSAFFVSTVAQAPWAFHLHLGYIANKNVIGEEEDIWHASYAVEREFGPLKLVADLGTETNPDQSSEIKPAFLILGLIYNVVENFDIDLGYKKGVTDTETDRAWLAGVQMRF